MKYGIVSSCPYCATKNQSEINKEELMGPWPHKKTIVVTCDIDRSGCDKDYVIYWNVEMKIETARIEK